MYEKLLELLKEARIKKGLKQQDVASMLGLKGNTISNWEKGRSQPDIEIFVKLCSIYDVNFSDLLNETYGSPLDNPEKLSLQEQTRIKKYRALDERGKETVDMTLNSQYEIVQAKRQSGAGFPINKNLPLVAEEQSEYLSTRDLHRKEMHRKFDEELDGVEKRVTLPASTSTNLREFVQIKKSAHN